MCCYVSSSSSSSSFPFEVGNRFDSGLRGSITMRVGLGVFMCVFCVFDVLFFTLLPTWYVRSHGHRQQRTVRSGFSYNCSTKRKNREREREKEKMIAAQRSIRSVRHTHLAEMKNENETKTRRKKTKTRRKSITVLFSRCVPKCPNLSRKEMTYTR